MRKNVLGSGNAGAPADGAPRKKAGRKRAEAGTVKRKRAAARKPKAAAKAEAATVEAGRLAGTRVDPLPPEQLRRLDRRALGAAEDAARGPEGEPDSTQGPPPPPPGERLMALAEVARAVTGKMLCATYRVDVDDELERRMAFSPGERAMLKSLAPQAEPYAMVVVDRIPQLAALAFAAAYVVSTAQLAAAIKDRAQASRKKKRRGGPMPPAGTADWAEEVRDRGEEHARTVNSGPGVIGPDL